MSILTAIAIDDEPIALEVIKQLARPVDYIDLKACFTHASKAKLYMQQQPVHLMFLDIKMPDISGIEFLKTLPVVPMVIFTTAYSEHAVRSYELNAIDYLLKPFAAGRFEQACDKARALYELKKNSQPPLPALFIKSGTEQIKVNVADILYVQSAGNYVQFIVHDQKITSRLTMQVAVERLPAQMFTRIHRSYLVANKHITKIEKDTVWVGSTPLPVGSAYAADIRHVTGT